GKTAGRGTKGQKAREQVRRGFEGGQIPIQKRMPYKRGFVNPFRVEYEVVNVGRLEELVADERLGATIDPDALAHAGAIDLARPLKILGDGDLTRALTVRAHKVTAGARTKIEAAGGTIELLDAGGGANDEDTDTAGDTA
ncbi:MAG TPA: 50S ribosomal protein L15, partial [Thermomicrobiales bacterium]|nr:50S ribosomal protein L15 [Thermomicrobiales bacterium]